MVFFRSFIVLTVMHGDVMVLYCGYRCVHRIMGEWCWHKAVLFQGNVSFVRRRYEDV